MTDTNHLDTLVAAVIGWDLKDIYDLLDAFKRLDDYCKENDLYLEHCINVANLPSADIPDDVDTGYPVWAMDVNGNMLVGESIDSIETLAEYREGRDYRAELRERRKSLK